MTKLLFLCTGNSCRSQMAEGWARKLRGNEIEAYSAGIEATTLDRRAVLVMHEVGVDISGHQSKSFESLKNINFDLIVTVCDRASESCPVISAGTKVVHAPFDDPPNLALGAKSAEEALSYYRKVRDEIMQFVRSIKVVDDH